MTAFFKPMRARKEHERLVLFNKRPNPVCNLVAELTDRPIGIRLELFPNERASSPTSYLTADRGRTFHHVLSVMSASGTKVQVGEEETNPETLASLRALLAAWGEGLAPV